MSGLPKGWVEASLNEVAKKITDGSHNPPPGLDSGVPMLSAKNIRGGRIWFDEFRRISPEEFERENRRSSISRDDVLMTIVGAIGRAAVVQTDEPFAVQRSVAVIGELTGLLPSYLAKYATGPVYQQWLYENAKGTAQKGVYLSKLAESVIAVPPLAEQERIVAKLDRLNAKSARARTELARIETLVSRYKQAVLSKAFSGELVGLVPDATEKPHALCWDLPLGWRWVAFEDAVEIASNLVNPNTIPELPHIAPDNIESGTARLLPFKTIREDGVISAKHRFFAGQILYSKIRPYLRKAVIADFDGACSADMYPLSPRDVLCARYLLRWLVSEQFTHFAVEHQGRTVLPKINQTALNKTPLPLPPLATQHEIVRRLESAFAKIDRLAKEAKRSLELVGRLDEAILAKAFRGELVPQDDNDEPAERLLARIRAEREAAPKVKKRVVKRTSAMLTARDFLNAKLPNWPHDGISFQDLRNEFSGSYDDLKDAVFALLSDQDAPLRQVFDEQQSTMTLRRREQ